MQPSLVIIDDELEVLKSLTRLLNKDFNLHAFQCPQNALEYLKEHNCMIVLSDMQMPKMNGAEILSEVARLHPLTKRVVLTGYADIEIAKQVVNETGIDGYYSKPWKNDELKAELHRLSEQYIRDYRKRKYVHLLKDDRNSLLSSKDSMISVIGDMLNDQGRTAKAYESALLINNDLIRFCSNLVARLSKDDNGHSYRVAKQSKLLALQLGLSEKQSKHLYLAALLYRVGFNVLPDDIKDKALIELTAVERDHWFNFVETSANILVGFDFLKPVARYVAAIFNPKIEAEDSGADNVNLSDAELLGARILRTTIMYDLYLSSSIRSYAITPTEVPILYKKDFPTLFDVIIADKLQKLIKNAKKNDIEVAIEASGIRDNMVVAQDFYNINQQKLIAQDTVITSKILEGLHLYQENNEHPVVLFIKGSSI